MGKQETEKGAPTIQSSSGTTIYDAAVEPVVAQPNQNQTLDTVLLETNAGKNRLSTSSEEIGDSSGELGATINNFENLDIFIEETRHQVETQPQRLPWGQDRDRFYQEPPQAGGSGANRGCHHQQQRSDKATRDDHRIMENNA